METIHIVTAANNKYAEPLAVMLYSLLKNKTSDMPVKIYIIDSRLTFQNKRKITKAIQPYKSEVKFLKIDSSRYSQLKTSGHLTKETYYRFSIPDILDKTIQKALYLDCDMVVKGDVTDLWNHDLGNNIVGAVENPGLTHRFKDLSIPETSKYFNAGVLLINLKKWREKNMTKHLLHYIKKNHSKIKLCSQDPLNALLHNKWLKIDPAWNYQVFRYSDLKIEPSIIHFTTYKKPWEGYKPNFFEEYFKYAEEAGLN
ncbi:glycosyltransferase family 8 protein [Salipaludibacillus aurantiacus]|uniref:Lipopolysaccharide biosynthesis protein, LPS:glycosyltransferase n=1 Tax=Salipaludibacillus aurantiacus TaxID=1601833 RepID=A0A1H9X6V1_9BACI|nr:glycosyltransferase family 8 protein [Salipaludibacillus aurantiacus]SES41809.1 Lipopolysaccharide biosynthesis protein, LPS:glycosyltransferase [Salipaludibacillus aurantiacus]